MANFTNFFPENANEAQEAIGIDNANDASADDPLFIWSGTRAEYDALSDEADPPGPGYDDATIYYVTDEQATLGTFLGLGDVDENTYTGHAGQSAVVNATEDGLVFEEIETGLEAINPSIERIEYGAFATTGDPTTDFTPNIHTHANLGGDEVRLTVRNLERPGVLDTTANTAFHLETTTAGTFDVLPDASVHIDDHNEGCVHIVLPARVAGDYRIIAVNGDGAESDPFTITYSDGPQWQTDEALSFNAEAVVNVMFEATGATDYTITTAPTPALPSYLMLTRTEALDESGTGTIALTGTVPAADAGTPADDTDDPTNYSGTFTITATDADNDTIAREFTLSVQFSTEGRYLCVAAGGSGGNSSSSGSDGGAGGGAGGMLEAAHSFQPGVYAITVGQAVGGTTAEQNYGDRGNNGNPSSIATGGTTIVQTTGGGGGGGNSNTRGRNGGSGGGGRNNTAGSGIAGQGFGGANATTGGGGGGAGTAAGDAPGFGSQRDGGDGRISTIVSPATATAQAIGEVVGTDVYFAGGGAGFNGAWGLGGGASTHGRLTRAARSVLPNSGGGGAGGDGAGSRGSIRQTVVSAAGVVVLRFTNNSQTHATTGADVTRIVEGDDVVYIFKQNGTITI